ncbi:AAEL002811-PA [Aedes aegypti]|uniref:AAEL002811-PA n=2 Tax=Aedes aegypti TaxID=7159 RepID=A0A1S4F2V0_AEDAE|nr:uncharacterized protein LOC5576124 [Aedes aegypti]EAT45980.1 AAEL002811-PA [Aedes aegypti]
MKSTVSLILLLAISGVRSLECYSCDSDLMDEDCDAIATLPKQTCQDVSDFQLVSLTCGYKRVQVGNLTERIFRGCVVAGECSLFNRQSELTSKYRMLSCVECNSDHCNTMRSGAGRGAIGGIAGSVVMLLSIFVSRGQVM